MTIQGRMWKYGDIVDTDAIIPARYLNVHTAEELAADIQVLSSDAFEGRAPASAGEDSTINYMRTRFE